MQDLGGLRPWTLWRVSGKAARIKTPRRGLCEGFGRPVGVRRPWEAPKVARRGGLALSAQGLQRA